VESGNEFYIYVFIINNLVLKFLGQKKYFIYFINPLIY
jgi:hypothetical protein